MSLFQKDRETTSAYFHWLSDRNKVSTPFLWKEGPKVRNVNVQNKGHQVRRTAQVHICPCLGVGLCHSTLGMARWGFQRHFYLLAWLGSLRQEPPMGGCWGQLLRVCPQLTSQVDYTPLPLAPALFSPPQELNQVQSRQMFPPKRTSFEWERDVTLISLGLHPQSGGAACPRWVHGKHYIWRAWKPVCVASLSWDRDSGFFLEPEVREVGRTRLTFGVGFSYNK